MTIQELQKKMKALIDDSRAKMSAGEMSLKAFQEEVQPQLDKFKAQIEALKSLDSYAELTESDAQPAGGDRLPMGGEPAEGENKGADKSKIYKTIQVLRYGDVDEHTDLVMGEAYGSTKSADWRQLLWDQKQAFTAYMRWGETAARKGYDLKSLYSQYWSPDTVLDMVKSGYSISEVKATMVEGVDILGGYAVPPQIADRIITRMAGLTAVRRYGATVVQTVSSSMRWIKLTGASTDERYPTALRGKWGDETQSPEETNLTFGTEEIPVELYTYKVPMSVSFLEDGQNIEDVFSAQVSTTLAVDEDDAFVAGTGVAGEPRGIVPGGTTLEDGITELDTGVADDIQITTTKQLRRQIASQYRADRRAVWLMNSDTAAEIELWQDGFGRFYFDTAESGDRLFGFQVAETEAMPDIAASAYPIVFIDLAGYIIVERAGLSVVRYNDSNTGINKVEFQIRRRVGGKLMEPWRAAALKCSA
jgi:HK97 family phage major capsid protein